MRIKYLFLILIFAQWSTISCLDHKEAQLLRAIKDGNTMQIKNLLDQKTDINQLWPDALIEMDYRILVDLLLKYGANVNAIVQGKTPLHIVIEEKYHLQPQDKLSRVELLLRKGADVTKKDAQGRTPEELITEKRKDPSRAVSPVEEQILEKIEFFKVKISKLKKQVFQQINAITNIENELNKLNQELVVATKRKDTNLAKKTQTQLTAKEKALTFNLNQFKKLIQQVSMGIFDEQGNSPLHKAVQSGNLQLVQWIFQFQPDLAKKANNQGQTPIDLAVAKPAILNFFMQAAKK